MNSPNTRDGCQQLQREAVGGKSGQRLENSSFSLDLRHYNTNQSFCARQTREKADMGNKQNEQYKNKSPFPVQDDRASTCRFLCYDTELHSSANPNLFEWLGTDRYIWTLGTLIGLLCSLSSSRASK